MRQLTEKETQFVIHYLENGGVATEAYKHAYNVTTELPSSIQRTAFAIMQRPEVKSYIAKAREEAWKANTATIAEIVSDLSDVIRFDIKEMYDENGNLKPLSKMPRTARLMIQGIEVDELYTGRGDNRQKIGVVKKVKLIPKLDAVEKLLKHLGAYEKHNTQKQAVTRVVQFQLPSNGRDAVNPLNTIDAEAVSYEEIKPATAEEIDDLLG